MKKLLLLTLASYLLTNTLTAQNLLTNGDFESGGSGNGFFVDGVGYTQLTTPFSGTTSAGNYAFVTNPLTINTTSFIASGDHTTGTGLMMVVDGNNTGGNQRFWKAGNAGGGVSGLTVGKKYEFSYWVKSIYDPTIVNSTRPNLGIQITNASSITPALSPTLVALPNNPWQRVTYSFIANSTTVNIELWNQNTGFEGNDFAVDDFAVVEAVSLQYSFLGTTCAGFANNNGSITVYGLNGTPPYSYSISGPLSQTNATGVFTTLQVGTYNVTVTDFGGATATASNIIIAAPTNINAGPDTTIPLGTSTTLTATNGTGVFNWSATPADPSLTTPNNASISVSPTQTTTYTVTTGPTYIRNLVYNGDFSQTNLGFTSEATYLNPTNPSNTNKTFGVVTNSSTWSTALSNCSAVGGTGKMLVYKGSNTAAVSTKVWKQIIPVIAGQNYDFSYLVQSLNYAGNAAMIDVTINGVTINSTNAPTSNCSWQSRNFTWNSGAATTAEICIVDRVTAVGTQNNAFAIDNIKFETITNCLFTDSVTVYILTATPSSNQLSINATTSNLICNEGESTTFTATYPDLKYTNSYIVQPKTYEPYPFNGGTILPTTNSSGTNDDDFWSTTIVMPFKFCFYQNTYTNFILGTNGVISFDQSTAGQTPDGFCQWAIGQNIPSTGNPVNSIFGVFQDIHYASRPPEAYINYYSLGTSPNRVMVVNYYHIPQFPAQASNLQTYQIVLHETTNIIEVNVERRVPNNGWNNGRGIIGIQNATATQFVVAPGRNALDPTWSATNESWQFVPSGIGPSLVDFHWESASNPGVVYSTANSFTEVIEDDATPETYVAVVEYKLSCDQSVVTRITDSATAEVNPPLPVNNPIDMCYNGSLPATINIDQTNNILSPIQVPDFLLTYFTNPADAETGNPVSQIPNEFAYNATSLPITIYVRIEDTASSGCYNVRSFVITNAPSGTFSYDATYCNSLLVDQLPVTSNLTTGGTFSATPISPTSPTSILIIDPTTGAITPSSDIGTYTVSYDIPATVTCLAFHYEFDVEILSCGCSVNAINNGPICEGSSVDLDVTTPVPGGTYTWTGPDSYNSGPLASPLVTVTPISTGNLTYNLSVTSPTGNCTSSTVVVVNPLLTAGTATVGPNVVCETDITTIDLYSLLTGEDVGGSWTRLTGTGGTFDATNGEFTPAVGATSSTFEYTVSGVAPCVADAETVSITINAAPISGTATAGTNSYCDTDTTTIIDLYSLLTGEATGGSWTRLTGTDGTFAAAGTFTPGNITTASSTSTFRYTVTGTLPCANATTDVTITVNNAPNAGTATVAPNVVCETDATTINLASLLTGEDTGGTWTRLTGTGGTFATSGTFTPAVGATSSTFKYTVAGVAPCAADDETVAITINPAPNSGTATAGTNSYCDTDTTTIIDLYSLLTGEATGGSWTRLTGTDGTFAAAGTFTSGNITTASSTSTFRYTVTGTLPCANATTDVTITVNNAPNAGTATVGPNVVCETDTTTINLASLIAGEDTGGTWTRLTGTGGTFTTSGTFTPAVGATSSTFKYTVAGVAPCAADDETVAITINPAPNSGTATAGSNSYCDTDTTTVIDLYSLLTGEATGGSWTRIGTQTDGTFATAAGTFTPGNITTASSTSTFRYTVTGTLPCANATTDVTITVNNAPNAGTATVAPNVVCETDTTTINLASLIAGEDTGGTWTRLTGTGGTFATSGTFTPAVGATSSTFKYTVAGVAPCAADDETVSITINAAPNSGTATAGTNSYCDTDTTPINLADLLTGEATGGSWTRLTGTDGTFAAAGTFTPGNITTASSTSTFRYTVTGTAPCANATTDVTITVNNAPNAGTATVAPNVVCETDTTTINLASLIAGEDTGGTWTRLTGTGGTFATSGTFTPAVGATSSTFKYTVAGVAPCAADDETVSITINAAPNSGTATAGTNSYCDNDTTPINLADLLTGEATGGSWTRLTGTDGTFAAAGTFTPGNITTASSTSTFRYTVTGTLPCANATTDVTITVNNAPNAGTATVAPNVVCETDATTINLASLLTGEDTGGTWTRLTGTGGTFATSGTFTPAVGATSSTFKYTVAGVAPCAADDETVAITINPAPNSGTATAGTNSYCDNDTTPINLADLLTGEATGGSWTRLTGTDGTFAAAGTFTPGNITTASSTSTFRYTVTGTLPCANATTDVTITVNNAPNAGTATVAPNVVCETDATTINLASLLTGEDTGGTWTRLTGTGGTFATSGTFTLAVGATSSTFKYTVAGVAPCAADDETVSITINAAPNSGTATAGSNSYCDTDTTTVIDLYSLLTGEATGGSWTRIGTQTDGTFATAAGTFTPGNITTASSTSTFRYTVTGTLPCANATTDVTITVNNAPNAGTATVAPNVVCETDTTTINLASLIAGEDTGGTWTRLTGTGGTFATSGTFTPAVGATSSTFKYTVAGVAPCAADDETVSITINAAPNSGTATAGTNSYCDTDTTPINLADLLTGEATGGSWTRLTGTDGTFAAAGTFTPGNITTASSTSTFRYTVTGTAPCANATTDVTITVNNAPNAGTATVGPNVVCETDTTTINLASLIAGEDTGGTWTRLTGTGGTFATSGTFTPAVGATSSTFKYEVAGSVSCPSNDEIVSITINPAANAGASSGNYVVCETDSTPLNLASALTGEQPNGVWTRISGTGGNFVASTGIFTPSIGTTTSVFRYTITGLAPCANDTEDVNVIMNQAVAPIFTQVAPICSGNLLTALPTTSTNGVAGTWSPFLNNLFTTEYTFTPAVGVCALETKMTIVVNPLPVIDLPSNPFICVDVNGLPTTSVDLETGLNPANYSFAWYNDTTLPGTLIPGETGSSYTATALGIYRVQATNNTTTCPNSASVEVISSLPPSSMQFVTSSYFSDEEMVVVNVTPAGDYEYQIDNGEFQNSNQFVGLNSGDHTIVVRDKFSCGRIEGTVTLFTYPKFFTPNGDDFNDTWNISDLEDQPNAKIYIFDRYGKLVKQIAPGVDGWNGTFSGNPLPADDYWFTVEYQEQQINKIFKSHFALKR